MRNLRTPVPPLSDQPQGAVSPAILTTASLPKRLRNRTPNLKFSASRGLGWYVALRDPVTKKARRHRFGNLPEAEARVQYYRWLADHLSGKKPEPASPGRRLHRSTPPTVSAAVVEAKNIVPGSLAHVAADLLRFDQERTREYDSARTRGTIHPRVRLNRKKMLLDFMEFMNGRYGQGALSRMKLDGLQMADVEAYNRHIATAGYSQSQVTERLQMVHALIERAGRPEFGQQLLGWNWNARDVVHGKPSEEILLPTVHQLKAILCKCDVRGQLMIWMGIGLGFGPSDLSAVRVGQIDKQNYDLRRGKTGLERYGDTPPLIWSLLSKYLVGTKREAGSTLFVTRTGKPLIHSRTNALLSWWQKLRVSLDEEEGTLGGFYALRHLGATEYGSRPGVSIGQVKRWLGHSASSRVADEYMKPVSPEKKAVVEWVRKSLASKQSPVPPKKPTPQ